MSTGMILLAVVVILFLIVIALPVVGGGISGFLVLLRGVLRKMWANRKTAAEMKNQFTQKPHLSLLK
jgi:hypothetical protein